MVLPDDTSAVMGRILDGLLPASEACVLAQHILTGLQPRTASIMRACRVLELCYGAMPTSVQAMMRRARDAMLVHVLLVVRETLRKTGVGALFAEHEVRIHRDGAMGLWIVLPPMHLLRQMLFALSLPSTVEVFQWVQRHKLAWAWAEYDRMASYAIMSAVEQHLTRQPHEPCAVAQLMLRTTVGFELVLSHTLVPDKRGGAALLQAPHTMPLWVLMRLKRIFLSRPDWLVQDKSLPQVITVTENEELVMVQKVFDREGVQARVTASSVQSAMIVGDKVHVAVMATQDSTE